MARRYPAVREIDIPARLSDTVTLSTMHGCPPDEIERISLYLLEERGLHTSVKCNPTLLGAERVRGIVNDALGYADVPIPDAAFGHDLRWADALPMFHNLRRAAAARGLTFGLKLSNTLEVENWRTVFGRDATMYMSGRALHPVTVNLAAALAEEFGGDMPLSFAGGADCFNLADLLALRPSHRHRLLRPARRRAATCGCSSTRRTSTPRSMPPVRRTPTTSSAGRRWRTGSATAIAVPRATAAPSPTARDSTSADYADRGPPRLALPQGLASGRIGPRRRAGWGCSTASRRPASTSAPSTSRCPATWPRCAPATSPKPCAITRLDNPLPAILGRVCDHLCENTCIRTHLDQPLAIRQIKRFIMEQERSPGQRGAAEPLAVGPATGSRVAIIGAGPAGLAAAEWLARAGVAVTIFEEHPYPGGMVGGAIPAYRLPQAQIDQDLAVLERLGVEIRYGQRAGVDVTLDGLRAEGFAAIFIAVGAQRAQAAGPAGRGCPGS